MSETVVYKETRQEEVPEKILKSARIIAGMEKDWRADAFRVLRTQLLQRLTEPTSNTVGITSPTSSDGKSLIAANLAVSLAMDVSHTVMLVDLDLRRARLAEYFGLTPSHGLTDYLLDHCDLNECLVSPGIARLVLLPQCERVRNSSEMLSSPKMKALMKELKERYPDRIIVYDLPPLLASDDALVMAPLLDATILVVRDEKTTSSEIESSLALLKDYNCLGTVLNRSRRAKQYYYY